MSSVKEYSCLKAIDFVPETALYFGLFTWNRYMFQSIKY